MIFVRRANSALGPTWALWSNMKRRSFAGFLSLLIWSLCAYGQTYQSSFENSRALLKAKRYSEALQEAQRAISLDGSQWAAYYVAGTALVGLERHGEAINLFQAALVHAPEQASQPSMPRLKPAVRPWLTRAKRPHRPHIPLPNTRLHRSRHLHRPNLIRANSKRIQRS